MNIEKMPSLPPTRAGHLLDAEHPVIARSIDIEGCHRVASHQHPRAQLIYSIRGVLRVMTAEGTWIVPPTQAVWVPSNVRHEIMDMASVSIRTLFIDPSVTADLSQTVCVVNVPVLLRELILKAVEIGDEYAANSASGRLMQVILDCLHDLQPAQLHLPMGRDARLCRVMDALFANPADERNLQQWADYCGASPRTLARLFSKETGMNFGDWRRQLRLLDAIERLGQGQAVTRVALDLGYKSASAFIAMFRRSVGQAPTRYFREMVE